MKSENIKLIEEEKSEKNFLNKVLNYFFMLNLNVKSKKDLRKMGNDEFNKGNYSRAKYLYSMANHEILCYISKVYEIDKDIQENNLNDFILKNFYEEILKNIKTRAHAMTTAIATNGILLKDLGLCKELIDSGVEYIDVSMKGGNHEAQKESSYHHRP